MELLREYIIGICEEHNFSVKACAWGKGWAADYNLTIRFRGDQKRAYLTFMKHNTVRLGIYGRAVTSDDQILNISDPDFGQKLISWLRSEGFKCPNS